MLTIEDIFYSIFPLENSKIIYCTLDVYHHERSLLYIKLSFNGESRFSLFFPDVLYLACPFAWHGADFELAPSSKCKETLIYGGFPEIYIETLIEKKRAYLFEINEPRKHIQIIARSVEKITNF